METELRRFTIHHIPYGLNLHHFHPIPDARSKLQLPHEQKIILYISYSDKWSLNPRKGLFHLAEAFFNMVFEKHPNTLLLVAGEGLVPNDPRVRPLGFIPQDKLPLYYSAADVFAAPTLADNLPYTILEAMGCARPVVASRVGGVPEEVEDGVTGYLVPPGNSHALGETLLTMLDNPEKVVEMGWAGRKRIEQIFNMENIIRRHEELYTDIVSRFRKV
jgi:glycosyltransferase involved in cell wall biosynthesis